MPRAKKPPAKKFTAHQITLDPDSARTARSIIGTAPEVNSLSAAIRHALRHYQAHPPRTERNDQ